MTEHTISKNNHDEQSAVPRLNKKVKNYFEQKFNSSPVKIHSTATPDNLIKQTSITVVEKDQGKNVSSTVPLAKKVVHVKTVKEEVIETPTETKHKRSSKKGTINASVKEQMTKSTASASSSSNTSTNSISKSDSKPTSKGKSSKSSTLTTAPTTIVRQSEEELLAEQNVKDGGDKNDFTNNRLINIKTPNKSFKGNNDKSDAANVERSNTTLLATNINKSSTHKPSNTGDNDTQKQSVKQKTLDVQSNHASNAKPIKAMVQDAVSKSNIEEFKSKYFTLEATKYNNTVKNGNYYAHDINGMLIRKSENNSSKTPYGWILIDGKPVNIHTDLYDMSLTHTLRKLKALQPNLFKKPSGTLYRAYKDIGDKFGINILTI